MLVICYLGTLPFMKCCPVALYFVTEPGGVSQDMAVSPDGEPAADNGQSQVQSQSQEDQASTEGLQKKPKAAPKKNSSSYIKLSDWVTSTTKIKVWWDQIIIDHDRKFGQVSRISDDRVQRRYDDLKAAPPVDYIHDLLFYKVTHICVVVFFSIVPFSRPNFRPCYEYSCCTATRWVLLGGQHVYTAAQKHKTEFEMKNMETPDWTLVFGGYEVKQDCPLRTRRRLAGLHEIQTTAGSASTTSERMSLLLDRLEDEDATEYTLYHHITVMLEECGVTAEEGVVVCFVY